MYITTPYIFVSDLFSIPADNNVNVTDTRCAGELFSTTASSSNPTGNVTSVQNATCTCLCQQLWTFMALPAVEKVNLTVEEKVEIIVKELKVGIILQNKF